MERIADWLTRFIICKNNIEEYEYDLYFYGFLTGLELMSFLATCLSLSFFLGMIPECIIFLSVFISIRSFAGGLHLKRFSACFLCSCAVLLGTLFLSVTLQVHQELTWLLIVISLIAIKYVAPVDNHNRPTDDNEQKYFEKKLDSILLLVLVLAIIIQLLQLDSYRNLIMITLLVVLTSMILGKLKYIAELRQMNN